LDLKIPKLRAGSFVPALLVRRPPGRPGPVRGRDGGRRHGVSTRKIDDLVKALGADTGVSKSEVSRICAGLDADVSELRDRPLAAQDLPDVSSTRQTARGDHRILFQAIVVAVAASANGRRGSPGLRRQ